MQVYGYPEDRVDFVSKSGSADSIYFGDSKEKVEDFFGPSHTVLDDAVQYYSNSVTIQFEDDKVSAVTIDPRKSSEDIEVYVGKEKLTGLSPEELEEAVKSHGVAVHFGEELQTFTFS